MPELTKKQINNAIEAMFPVCGCFLDENSVKTIAPHVQYAPTEPGAPLNDEEWKSIVGDMNTGLYRGNIDAVLAKRNVRKEAPKPGGDLIGRASSKAREALGHGSGLIDVIQMTIIISAAALVIADALLGPVTNKEWASLTGRKFDPERDYWVTQLLLIRRSSIEATPKTPEERVKIEPVAIDTVGGIIKWEKRLYRDGKELKHIDVLNYARLGLIAEMAKERP